MTNQTKLAKNEAVGVMRSALVRAFVTASCCFAALGCTDEAVVAEPAPNAFAHVEGEQIVDASGAPLALEGIGLGDFYYRGSEPPRESHGADDYAQVAAMGMNHGVLYFNAQILEDDSAPGVYKEDGVAWLDDNVEWARSQGLYLSLALSAPPGGSAVDCSNDVFWDSPELQDRAVALWRMLAARYAKEPTVFGYSLMEIPNPSTSLEQWEGLAARITKAVREVDRHHVLLVGRAVSIGTISSGCEFDGSASATFFRVEDTHVVYQFDALQPWSYVAQTLAWVGNPNAPPVPPYGPYPNPTRFRRNPGAVDTWLHASDDGRPSGTALRVTPDQTEWAEKSFVYIVTDPRAEYALPVLQSDFNSGKVYFDDIRVEERVPSGEWRTLLDIDIEDLSGWHLWEGDAETTFRGTASVAVEDDAHRGRHSVSISGATTLANLGASDARSFLVTLGNAYRVTSWTKGENSDPRGMSFVRIDLWASSEELHGFERQTLEDYVSGYAAWGKNEGVPMLVSAFGTGRPTFANGLGGADWVSDMINVLREQGVQFTYYAYRQADFGIYSNAEGPPDPTTINQALVDRLTEKLW